MKIIVLNGSPKGELGVTMQYVDYLQKNNPDHTLKIIHIAQQVKQIEKDEQIFSKVLEEIRSADAIIWAFPLYVFLVHSQYKRFVELIHERSVTDAFRGKYAALLSTSIHFYDHTAHNYMRGICEDLDMNFYDTFSAEMRDLLKESERKTLLNFFRGFTDAIERKAPCVKQYAPLVHDQPEYTPTRATETPVTHKQKIVIVTDAAEDQMNLQRMIRHFSAQFAEPPEIVNLRQLDIKGSCLGCIQCGYDNTCVYEGKDEFIGMFNSKLKTADILVFAGTIRDRYLSSLWKTFFDRAFFNTHMPSFVGRQMAFLVSGPLQQLPNLRQILEAYTEHQQANLVGIVTDEQLESTDTDAALHELAMRSVKFADENYIKPHTFLGVGGLKIFRDEIWGPLRFPFVADHQYYKQHGIYDFPHQDYRSRAQNFLLGLLAKIPAIRRELYGPKMKEYMIKAYQKINAEGK